jgi:hypothetical protein
VVIVSFLIVILLQVDTSVFVEEKHVILSQFRYLRFSTWACGLSHLQYSTSRHSTSQQTCYSEFSFTLPAYSSIGSDAFSCIFAKVVCCQHYHDCLPLALLTVTWSLLPLITYAPILGSFLATLRGKCDPTHFRVRTQNSSLRAVRSPVIPGPKHGRRIWYVLLLCVAQNRILPSPLAAIFPHSGEAP